MSERKSHMVTGSRVERKKYQKRKRPNRGRKWFKRIIITIIALAFICVLGGAGLFGYYAMNAPDISAEDLRGQVSSKIFDKDGELIKELGGQNRDLMAVGEVPQVLKEAVLAIEDARFYQHHGVDPIRIVGALVANLRAGEIEQGGSTITQQLVKLSVFSTDFQDQTIERKAQEAWLSLQIEQEYSKDEILTLYLNKLFYSNNVYGAKTASKHFFGKPLAEINLGEAALLAGIPQAPSEYDPYSHPEIAQERRDLVLDVMYERDLINEQELSQAKAIQVEDMLVPLNETGIQANDLAIDAYLDVVAQEVQDKLNLNIYTDGLEVYTNMDFAAQKHLYNIVNDGTVPFPNDQMQTASSVIDVNTGHLIAVIGGRKQEVTMGLNRANTLNRSVGSTMKPLSAYGPAIEYLNFSTGTLVKDEPYEYSSGDPIENYDYAFKGDQTLREALAGSRNIPALKMLQAVGLDNAYAFLQKMDIHILNNNQRELVEANAIGGEMTPIQLSAAYATIANYGTYNKPSAVRQVITSAGTVEDFQTESREAMKDSTAYMLIDILKGVPGNFASRSDIEGLHHAGKTGTTNYTEDQLAQLDIDASTYAAPDGWYAGMTPQYAIASWVGYDNPLEPGHYLSLADTALSQDIYREMMTFLTRNATSHDWQQPSSVVEVEIEKYTDPIMLPGPRTPENLRSNELFVKGQEPTEISMTFGQDVPAPTGFNAYYDAASHSIVMSWNPMSGSGHFELSVNGSIIYTGPGTSFVMPAEDIGTYTLRLSYVEGNNRSDTMVITLTLTEELSSSSEESSEDEEDSSDESATNPDGTPGDDPALNPPAEQQPGETPTDPNTSPTDPSL
ncbi:transglycosylase domain-containing protein [Suicoccus acidiformans]|nr:PBP1A family penicillin-binding protein [Suicoccus acidiformans]